MDVSTLIALVRERRPLWDRKHAHYHDRLVTMGMWAEVAGELNTNPDTTRTKWKGLRDTFRGELRKVNKSIANGIPCTSTNWEYFEAMNFVKDQIYSNKRCLAELYSKPSWSPTVEENGNVDPAVLCKTEVVETEDMKPIKCERTESPPGTPGYAVNIVENKPAYAVNIVENKPTNAVNIVENKPGYAVNVAENNPPVQQQPHILPTDDDYNFLMSILPQLRSLPTMRNLFVRLKIQELLYNEIVTLKET